MYNRIANKSLMCGRGYSNAICGYRRVNGCENLCFTVIHSCKKDVVFLMFHYKVLETSLQGFIGTIYSLNQQTPQANYISKYPS